MECMLINGISILNWIVPNINIGQEKMRSSMFIVTGMHRSGTSCVTGVLSKCGLSLGKVFDINDCYLDDNPKGNFENMGMYQINEEILNEAQGTWFTPPDRIKISQLTSRKKIRQFCKLFDGDIVKDPRITILIDFYIQNCPSIEKIVHCVRHPLAVANSLYRRNKFSLDFSLMLWLHYNEYFLNHNNNYPVIYVNYEKLLSDLLPQTQRILDFLGTGVITSEVSRFVDKRLNHYSVEKYDNKYLDREVYEMYKKLLHKCNEN